MCEIKKQLLYRSIITKVGASISALIGLLVLTSYYNVEITALTQWGFFLWYATFGGIIAAMGFVVVHPIFPKNKTLRSIIRGLIIGGWLNFVLVFFAYDSIVQIAQSFDCLQDQSPFVLLVFEGMLFGAVLDYLGTRFGG